jgi:hypothetical protein
MRVRLIPMPLPSFRYPCRRASVQHANGRRTVLGSVRAVAITVLTCSGLSVAGRPDRGRSFNPVRPWRLKRLSQRRTVVRVSCSS